MGRVRARLIALPAAVTPLIIGEDDAITIETLIEEAVDDALKELTLDETGDYAAYVIEDGIAGSSEGQPETDAEDIG